MCELECGWSLGHMQEHIGWNFHLSSLLVTDLGGGAPGPSASHAFVSHFVDIKNFLMWNNHWPQPFSTDAALLANLLDESWTCPPSLCLPHEAASALNTFYLNSRVARDLPLNAGWVLTECKYAWWLFWPQYILFKLTLTVNHLFPYNKHKLNTHHVPNTVDYKMDMWECFSMS